MEAKLIYIECNIFSGVMRVQLGQMVLSIELGTPNFNDYGEYRLSSLEIKPLSLDNYKEIFPHPLMNYHLCELSEKDAKFWERHNQFMLDTDEDNKAFAEEDYKQIEVSQDDSGNVICGQDKNKIFHVWYDNKWIPYDEWKEKHESNSFNKLMYTCAELFYKWYNEMIILDYKPSNNSSLNIYPQ